MITYGDQVPKKTQAQQTELFQETASTGLAPITKKQEHGAELVVGGRDIMYKYGLSNENPDTLIATKGYDYLEHIENDTHLSSQLATRRQKLIKKGWQIKPFERNGKATARAQEICDFVNDQLIHMKGSFEKDVEAMLDAIGKGFSLTEINYQFLDRGRWRGKTGLKSLRFKPAKYFSFKYDKYGHFTPRQIDPDPGGVDLNLSKFIHLVAGANDENPYGDSVSSKCAFWVWLKENEAKFWAIYSERFGMPLPMVEMPNSGNIQDADIKAADDLIEAIAVSNGIKVPKGFNVAFLEASRHGDAAYEKFIEICNKEISKIVLGQTLATEEGKRGGGSYAMGQGHTQIMEDYIIFDAAITSQAINEQLIKRLVDLNWSTSEYPTFEWLGVNISSLISFSQSIGTLVDKGFKVPVSYIRNMTGIPEPKNGEEVLQPVQQFPGSEPAPKGLDNKSKNFSSTISDIEEFKEELPDEVKQDIAYIDNIHERYMALATNKYAEILKNVQERLKKKAPSGQL